MADEQSKSKEYPKPWVSTPLKESAALSKAAGCARKKNQSSHDYANPSNKNSENIKLTPPSRVFLKLENLQPSGSFKSRGVGNYMLSRLTSHPTPSSVHFYSSSGGNAGLACVHAANTLSLPSTIIVPQSTKPSMIAKIRAAGATDVIQVGASWADADAYLRSEILGQNEGGVYVPPFDHPDIWAGNARVVHEIREQLNNAQPDAIVCSVGGGGLFNGLVQGMGEVGWGEVPLVALETVGADSLNQSVRMGEHVTLPGITSRASCLGAVRVAEKTWENARDNRNVVSVAVRDEEAAMGCWRLADDERLLVELACGVSVVVCYGGRLQRMLKEAEERLGREVKLGPESKVVIMVCGGSDVNAEMLASWREEFGWIEKNEPSSSDVPSSHTAPQA